MRTIALAFLMIISSHAFAADRTEKIHKLMEAQGLVQMFEQQIDVGRSESERQAKQVLDQFMAQLNPPDEYDVRFRSAFNEFTKALEAPWTAKDIVDLWAKAYGKQFTDQELDDLVAFYTSPLGKKDILATQAALPELTTHFAALSNPLLERAANNFIQRLKSIAKECRCDKDL